MTNIKIAIFAIGLFLTLQIEAASIKILFDNTKAETAGNADWVISNSPNPSQVPTPAQSGISSTTTQEYWTGGLSAWGVDCVKKGYYVETLPSGKQITYGNSSNAQDLSKYNIYIVCEPNTQFTATEKAAIVNFVKNGGSLFMISDHNQSDRNSDGWDSPNIWNDLLTTNTVKANPFGISFDLVSFSQTTSNIAALPKDSVLHGPMGNVTQAMWAAGTTMTLDKSANSSVVGLIFKTGASNSGTTNVMFATCLYGNGKVAAIGDSSPCDDGTGDPGDTLYDGYITDAGGNHQKLLMNATIWLATPSITTGIKSIETRKSDFQLYPNPVSDGKLHVNYSLNNSSNTKIQLFDATGKNVKTIANTDVSADSQNESIDVSDLRSGIYLCRLSTGKETITKTVIIRK